jgi:hypothetical protein
VVGLNGIKEVGFYDLKVGFRKLGEIGVDGYLSG